MKSQEIQRDYNKDPIVILDYNTLFAFIPTFFLIPLLIYIYIYNPGEHLRDHLLEIFL